MYFLVDCTWGNWTIGECSETCGDGVHTDRRSKTQGELYGGTPCDGQSTNNTKCKLRDCPSTYIILNRLQT